MISTKKSSKRLNGWQPGQAHEDSTILRMERLIIEDGLNHN